MTAIFKRMLASFFAVKRWGEVVGFDISVETLLGRIRLTPGATNNGVYEQGTVRIEGTGFGIGGGHNGVVRASFERAEFRIVVLDGVIQQALVGQDGADVFGGTFIPREDSVPAAYIDSTGRVFDIGLLPTSAVSTPFVVTEGFWHRGSRLGRFQDRAQGLGLLGAFQKRLTVRVVEGRVDVLDASIGGDGRIVRGAILIRPEPRVVLEFDSLRVFIHLAAGAITHAQLFVRNGKLAQSEFQRLEALGQSTRLTFPEDV